MSPRVVVVLLAPLSLPKGGPWLSITSGVDLVLGFWARLIFLWVFMFFCSGLK